MTVSFNTASGIIQLQQGGSFDVVIPSEVGFNTASGIIQLQPKTPIMKRSTETPMRIMFQYRKRYHPVATLQLGLVVYY